MIKRTALTTIAIGLLAASARANICGTDYQNFNPTTNGLDFVTVQSSETLRPCIINSGLFFNYAANSLTYSKTLNADYVKGQKRKDRMIGMDVSLGMGLTDRWDIGVNIPFLLSQSVQDDYYVSSFDRPGATEIKANTKYQIVGDESGGVAGIVSLNKNLIEDNPFAGKNAGLTWNFELAADTTFAKHWAAGVNLGYRKRSPGEPIPSVPFLPMGDQWIYSAAASYLVASIDTKIIAEVYGSRATSSTDQDTDRNLSSLEGLLGVKHDFSQNLAAHFGVTRQIDASLGGPDYRVYAGFNWALGPVCKTAAVERVEPPAPQLASNEPDAKAAAEEQQPPATETFKLDVEILFRTNVDNLEPDRFAPFDSFFKDVFSKGFDRLVIEGHTDSIGPASYNQTLSERRAKFVRQYLIEAYKLPPAKVESVGFGQSQPVADNGNYQGRRKNRRVELKIWRSK